MVLHPRLQRPAILHVLHDNSHCPPPLFITLLAIPRPSLAVPRGAPLLLKPQFPRSLGFLGPSASQRHFPPRGWKQGCSQPSEKKLGILRLGSSHIGGRDRNVPSGDEAGSAARRAPRKGFGRGIAPLSGRPFGLAARRRRGGGRRRHVVGSPYKYGRRPRRRRRPSARQGA